jgi:3-hydroxyisobutyrate dehydrogenase-like beta-hydroxyacid dehydrogenase
MGRVAVLGMGIMGGPMARNLLRAGHEVTVGNRAVQKTEALDEEGARVASTPADAVRDAESFSRCSPTHRLLRRR